MAQGSVSVSGAHTCEQTSQHPLSCSLPSPSHGPPECPGEPADGQPAGGHLGPAAARKPERKHPGLQGKALPHGLAPPSRTSGLSPQMESGPLHTAGPGSCASWVPSGSRGRHTISPTAGGCASLWAWGRGLVHRQPPCVQAPPAPAGTLGISSVSAGSESTPRGEQLLPPRSALGPRGTRCGLLIQ